MCWEYYILTSPTHQTLVSVQNGRVSRIGKPMRKWRGKEVTLLKSRVAAQNWSLVRVRLDGPVGHRERVLTQLRRSVAAK